MVSAQTQAAHLDIYATLSLLFALDLSWVAVVASVEQLWPGCRCTCTAVSARRHVHRHSVPAITRGAVSSEYQDG